MDDITELLVELFWDGAFALSTDNRLPKWVRYPTIGLIVLLFAAVVAVILMVGILMLRRVWFAGLLFLGLGVFFAYWGIRKFRRVYILKKDNWN